MSKRVLWFIPALACIVLPAPVAAGSIPSYTTFGTLSGATFGGTGIPNNAVAITTITDGSDTITLGLTAFGRYLNPQPQNNGAGVFQALTGANYGDPTFHTQPSATIGATWNYGVYMNVAGGGTFADYTFKLLYDFDPAPGTPESALGTLDYNAAALGALGGNMTAYNHLTNVQDNQNLDFSFFATTIPSIVTPPTSPSTFNPNAVGEYSLVLEVFDGSNNYLGDAAILVDVAPEPASFTLLGIGAIAVCAMRGRRKGRES